MPLVIITGFPKSGKTKRAEQLKKWVLENKGKFVWGQNLDKVVLLNEEFLNINKDLYNNSNDEKKVRGALVGAVERYLNKKTLVICDSMNYIKGIRYQMYCIARSIGTLQCVVHICTSSENCSKFNSIDNTYDNETLKNLISRYEEPNEFNRWDKPLFNVQVDDLDIPCEKIMKCLFEKEAPLPNLSTISVSSIFFIEKKPAMDNVKNIDQTIQKATKTVLERLKDDPLIQKIDIENASIPVLLNGNRVTLIEMKRHQHQFMKLYNHLLTSNMDDQTALNSFVEYLNSQFK
ncbi:chromatin associated protein KTI12 [Rozella allomycis CSF55]|uniref:Chromatin associated protein KTI12 n=1 Tax=Rozella allomycis (strain CSF55) TaxID=988480 RepID=A0A075AVD8_ROZAC|nr:Chromatin associated protein KTI12 domain-containing protein [Rozella allomycis CSF55]RKP20746.1 chromatin associated protein KTI12 [Rozella allomycis CSF55]|eukprot:EPZ32514.1 Chromatin associated protein KTI12 domain-containing protein [Rozella allomycis CSF55]